MNMVTGSQRRRRRFRFTLRQHPNCGRIWASLPMICVASTGSRKITARTSHERKFIRSDARLGASTMLPQFIPALFSLFSSHSASRRNIAKDFVSRILKKRL
jgi:hypothetical protein